jgi:hypothetical protein
MDSYIEYDDDVVGREKHPAERKLELLRRRNRERQQLYRLKNRDHYNKRMREYRRKK